MEKLSGVEELSARALSRPLDRLADRLAALWLIPGGETLERVLARPGVAVGRQAGGLQGGVPGPDQSGIGAGIGNGRRAAVDPCEYHTLAGALPRDTPAGRWEQARLELDVALLMSGLPSAIA